MRALCLAGFLALAACATAPVDDAAWTKGVSFAPMGGAEKASAAFLTGAQGSNGLYTIRVRIEKGGSIAPHTHPDQRVLTVVSGEVYYGFGTVIDTASAKLYGAGAVFVVPAGAPHWSKATTRDVVYQEAGMGPTALTPVR